MSTTVIDPVDPREHLLSHLRGSSFHAIDLRGADLTGADLASRDFEDGRFDGARLTGSWLVEGRFDRASFVAARLERAWCAGASFREADFRGASLAGTNLRGCDCRGADFTDAGLNGTTFDGADLRSANLSAFSLREASLRGARYDELTRFPSGFEPRDAMEWVGVGPAPLRFDVFVKHLTEHVDSHRLARAIDMLEVDRFQFYSRVEPDAVLGVVQSQRDSTRAYSCRLTSLGDFACCKSDLSPCQGMNGSLCKHILVLVVVLARSKQIGDDVIRWVQASRRRKPRLDIETLAEPLLRCKCAMAGELDWRPTETLPEDYYAL